jgi:hypothetical protein
MKKRGQAIDCAVVPELPRKEWLHGLHEQGPGWQRTAAISNDD